MTTDPKLIEREQKPREKFQKLWSEMVRNCEDEKYKQILGCNFPIIIGSSGIVHHLESLGFDIFDDIIDHAYDSISDPMNRTITAIESNRKLLSDPEFAKQMWTKNKNRFLNNLDHSKKKMYDLVQDRVLNQFKKMLIQSLTSTTP